MPCRIASFAEPILIVQLCMFLVKIGMSQLNSNYHQSYICTNKVLFLPRKKKDEKTFNIWQQANGKTINISN